MGEVTVTDLNLPAITSNQIIIVRPYRATPTPTSRPAPESYYSFNNRLYKLLQPAYDYTDGKLLSYVPKATTITINGVTQNLSTNRSWTVGDVSETNYTNSFLFMGG